MNWLKKYQLYLPCALAIFLSFLMAVALLLNQVLAYSDGLGIYDVTSLSGQLPQGTWLQHAYSVDGVTYLTATYTDKNDGAYESGIALYKINLEGQPEKTECFRNSFEKSENGVSFSTYSGIIPLGNGNTWAILRQHTEEYTESGIAKYTTQKLVCSSADGEILREIDLSEAFSILGTDIYAEQLFFEKNGEMILYGTGVTAVLDADGTLLAYAYLGTGEYLENLVQLSGGGVVGIKVSAGERQIVRINPRNATAENMGKLPVSNAKNIYPARKGNRILISSRAALYSYDLRLGRLELLVNWINSGINPARLTVLSQLSGGDVLVYESRPDYTGVDLMLLSPVQEESTQNEEETEGTEITRLEYACISVDEETALEIIAFNESHDTVNIAVRDYSVYSVGEDNSPAAKRLMKDIEKGRAPHAVNAHQFAEAGVAQEILDTIPSDVFLVAKELVDSQPNTETE